MEFINEFMWQEMRIRKHIYTYSGFLEKKNVNHDKYCLHNIV